mmetsp:Transcript_8674/g.8610  ORF Transcript_8674/g.8610 Transcript_8674/m.8610 type:complete len:148 (+) Transcript_8674:49-492(+)
MKCIIAFLVLSAVVQAFVPQFNAGLLRGIKESETKLEAHHVQKKIVKLKIHTRPMKHRPSDINRRNVNLDKCITKVEGAPSDYTIVSAADYMKVREKALLFWEHGSPVTPWLDITEEDMILTLPMNVEPLPVGGVQKKPSIVKSGSC